VDKGAVQSDGLFAQANGSKSEKSGFLIRWASIAVASAIIALSGWALSSPIGSSPDDDYHLPSIWCGQGFRDGLCEKDPNPELIQVPYTTFSNSVCFQYQDEQSGACPYNETLTGFPRVNNLKDYYPPVFYWTMSWFAGEDIALSTITMRIVNSIFAVMGLTLLVLSLPHHLRRVPIIGILISSIPLGFFIIASTNPSGWSFFSLMIFFSSLLGFFVTKTVSQKWLLGAITLGSLILASGSRSDASVFAVIAIGIVLLLNFSKANMSRTNLAFAAALLMISITSYFLQGTGSSIAGGALALPGEDASTPNFFVNLASLPNLWIGVFGTSGLGWLDTEMPAIVWAVTLCIYAGLIFLSMRWFSAMQSLSVATIFASLIVIPMYVLTASGLSVGEQVQPRYLLPLIGLLGATAIFRTSRDTGLQLTKGQAWTIGVGLFVANTIALHLNARRYITGMDELGVDLNKNIEWWWSNFPLSPNLVTWSASVAFAIFLVAIWKLREPLGLPGNTKEAEAK
jgi:hypothetical protein